MKKFLALMLALCTVFALCACGKHNTTDNPTAGQTGKHNTTVNYMADFEASPKAYHDGAVDLWGNSYYDLSDITHIVFGKSLSDAGANAWDVSAAHDGSILAWVEGSTLYVGADGKVSPNENAACLFAGFENLVNIDFADSFDTSNVTDMDRMFIACISLTSLDVSSFDTSNVTDMSSMFWACRSLTSLDLSSFDTSNVTNMYGMFGYCESLTSLDVSSFDTSNVTDMDGMFSNCDSLTSLDLSSFDTSNVTDMDRMFSNCDSLTLLDVSSFVIRSYCETEDMFEGVRCEIIK